MAKWGQDFKYFKQNLHSKLPLKFVCLRPGQYRYSELPIENCVSKKNINNVKGQNFAECKTTIKNGPKACNGHFSTQFWQ